MSQDTNKEQLERITEICQDGYNGYQTAASNLEDQELKTIFNRLAQQRKLFLEELKEDARSLGYDLNDDGSVQGFFHRTWINVKDFFTTSENAVVIESSLQGERKAKEIYEEVLKDINIPTFVKERLEKQVNLISAVIVQLEKMNVHVA